MCEKGDRSKTTGLLLFCIINITLCRIPFVKYAEECTNTESDAAFFTPNLRKRSDFMDFR